MSTPPAGSSKIVGNFRESEREDLQLWFKRDRDACLHTSDFVIFILSVFSFEEEGPAFFLDLTFALIWAAGFEGRNPRSRPDLCELRRPFSRGSFAVEWRAMNCQSRSL